MLTRRCLVLACAIALAVIGCSGQNPKARRASASGSGRSNTNATATGTLDRMPRTLTAPVVFSNGTEHLVPAGPKDTTSVTNAEALHLFNEFVPTRTLYAQPKIFLARFTDDTGSNRLVVAVVADGPPEASSFAVKRASGTRATLVLTVDASTGKVDTFYSGAKDPLPHVSVR